MIRLRPRFGFWAFLLRNRWMAIPLLQLSINSVGRATLSYGRLLSRQNIAVVFSLLGWFSASALPGHIYFVLGSDTAIWNAGTTVDVYTRHPYYSQESFTLTNSPSYQVMD